MKYCPNCGVEVEDDQRFCGECGAQLVFDPLPAEPVYTQDEHLKNDPALSASQNPGPKQKKEPKVPELTLEPDVWGMGPDKPAEPKPPKKTPELTLEPDVWGLGAAAAAAAKPAEPAPAAQAPQAAAAAAAAIPAPKAEDSTYAYAKEEIPFQREQTRPARPERQEAPEQDTGRQEAPKQDTGWQQASSSIPNDYTMSGRDVSADGKKLPDETLMLIWSIILSCTFSICGIVGLIKTIKARKTQDRAEKYRLLSAARIWLIVGTAIRALPILGELL